MFDRESRECLRLQNACWQCNDDCVVRVARQHLSVVIGIEIIVCKGESNATIIIGRKHAQVSKFDIYSKRYSSRFPRYISEGYFSWTVSGDDWQRALF